jgi:hypothetical protein
MENPLSKIKNMRSVKMEKPLGIIEISINKFENPLGKTEKSAQ